MERKAFATEFKVDAALRRIEGYASTFGNRDLVNDVVVKGAYQNTLAKRGDRIKALRDHAAPIGRIIQAQEDSTGLFVVKQISDTPLGNETMTLVADGVLDSMSIGYQTVKADYGLHSDGQKARFLRELRLQEVSVVTFPANEAAVITGVKSLADLDDLMREIKAGAYAPEVAARLLHQAADKLLTLPATVADDAAPQEPKSDDDTAALAALRSLVGEIHTHIRRAA